MQNWEKYLCLLLALVLGINLNQILDMSDGGFMFRIFLKNLNNFKGIVMGIFDNQIVELGQVSILTLGSIGFQIEYRVSRVFIKK